MADLLAWMDLEMTGLDTERDVIVEIAALVTTSDLEPVDDGIDIVVHQPEPVLTAMSEFVTAMHERSGLLTEIKASKVELADAGAQVLDYLKQHLPEPGLSPLCGNSIGVDRRFLARYLPDIEHHLHYRSIDDSSLKELCRRWYPDQYKDRPGKKEGHRALADVLESVAELTFYRATIFRTL